MVEALRAQGLPVAYIPFEGEQHGFRRAENIKRALEAELYFYAKVFGFAACRFGRAGADCEPLTYVQTHFHLSTMNRHMGTCRCATRKYIDWELAD